LAGDKAFGLGDFMSMKDIFDSAEKAGKAERVTALRVALKEGDSIVGLYLGRDLVTGKKKGMSDSYSYRFETDDGPITVFLSSAYDKQHGDSMIEGDLYKITYKEKIKISEGRTYKVFDVKRVPQPAAEPESEGPKEE
jgi:hypothetical protein